MWLRLTDSETDSTTYIAADPSVRIAAKLPAREYFKAGVLLPTDQRLSDRIDTQPLSTGRPQVDLAPGLQLRGPHRLSEGS